jgi:hypothetical protein
MGVPPVNIPTKSLVTCGMIARGKRIIVIRRPMKGLINNKIAINIKAIINNRRFILFNEC